MDVPASIAAEQGILRQNVALSVIKQTHDAQQALVQIIEEASRSAPVSQSRGTNVNLSA
ncbi:MAG: hypothetical protein DHS20C02_10070 [Micavibrio sp.]|nr:MAG: hypothetical protein DHS20C02_10070 [Micavibrio sp.]